MPEALGIFSYAFTIVFFAANFIDLGLSTYGIRKIAKRRDNVSVYVSEILTLRTMIAVALCVMISIAFFFIPASWQLKILIAESSLMLIGMALATEWAFQGIEKMRYVFISFAVTSSIQFILMYLFVKSPSDVYKVPIFYFLAMLPIIVIYLRKLRFKFLIRRADFVNMFSHLSSAFVIWSISICAQVYNNLDVVLLGSFRKIDEVGYFTIARRFVGGAAVLLVFLANAAFPRLSLCCGTDQAQFNKTTRSFSKLAIFLAVFLCVPVILASDYLIRITVGPQYIPASVPLKIMMIGLLCILFNLPYSTGLIASGLEKDVLKQAVASASVSITANLILIPAYGMLGAAVSFVLAEALALVWILTIYHKRIAVSV